MLYCFYSCLLACFPSLSLSFSLFLFSLKLRRKSRFVWRMRPEFSLFLFLLFCPGLSSSRPRQKKFSEVCLHKRERERERDHAHKKALFTATNVFLLLQIIVYWRKSGIELELSELGLSKGVCVLNPLSFASSSKVLSPSTVLPLITQVGNPFTFASAQTFAISVPFCQPSGKHST